MEEIKLDPKKPMEAIQIIDSLTYDKLDLSRREGDIFHSSLQTLRLFVETHLQELKEIKKTTSKNEK